MEGWRFERWEGDINQTANPVALHFDKNVTVTGHFAKREYPLSIIIEGEGTVREEVVQTKSADYEHGTVVRLTAIPLEGWLFVGWSGDVEGSESSVEIVIDKPREVTATFSKREYPLEVRILGQGTVDKQIVQSKSPDYPHGTVVRLTAKPVEGYVFERWEIDLKGDENPATIEMNSEKRIVAVFWDKKYGAVYDIDGNKYKTIVIGEQEWMAENLRTAHYRNGDIIATGLSDTQWSRTTEGAYAVSPHSITEGLDSYEEVVLAYGKLYNWHAVSDNRGLCPEGWRIPSDQDWTQLVDFAVSQGFPNEVENPQGAGNALKSRRQVNSQLGEPWATDEHPRWNPHVTHYGTNELGFSGLPGGSRSFSGFYTVPGEYGYWWSSSEHPSVDDVWYQRLSFNLGSAIRHDGFYRHGWSVRCLKD